VVRGGLNTRVSWWRRRSREVALPDAVTEHAGDGGLDSPVDHALMTALRRLPRRQRQVIALRIFLDLATARTADVLGIAQGTVTAHLARAISALRSDLLPVPNEESHQ
jgi:DNA-directed RNA polymerase specialized sigma24 family protein